MEQKNYYLGLDIGTNSVGYAVTDENYNLIKHGGEAMWGSHVFESGNQAEERRGFRTARRRSARKKQRVTLLNEIFAPELAKVDERFLIRRKESALYREDVESIDQNIVFNDKEYNDSDYYHQFPTIHHLIVELMQSDEPHDIRLVYEACAYIVAHRGHFLSDVSSSNVKEVLNFQKVYQAFETTYERLYDELPWNCDVEKFSEILKEQKSISVKEKSFLELLNNGKKFKSQEGERISKEGIIKLLSGGTYDLQKLFPGMEVEEKTSVCLKKPEEEFLNILSLAGEEADILIAMRNLYDWATLADILKGKNSISEGKVQIYEQHKKDLK